MTKAQAQATNLPTAAASQLPVASKRQPVGLGFEEADSESFSIPFLVILQSNSPQVTELENAKPGMLIDSVTNELYKEALVIPCYFQRRHLRWAPRESGGGFRGQLTTDEKNKLVDSGEVAEYENRLYFVLPDGGVSDKKCDRLSDTRNHFVLVRNGDGEWTRALISLASTQIKKSKQWLTKIQLKGGDMFNFKYPVGTVQESNDKGKWFGLSVGAPQLTTTEERAEARAFYDSVASGQATAKFETTNSDDE